MQFKNMKCYNCGKSGNRQSDCTMPRIDKSKCETDKSKRKRNSHRKRNNSGSDNESIHMLRDGSDFPSRESWIRSEFNYDVPAVSIWNDFIIVGNVVYEIGRSTSTNYKPKRIPVASLIKQSSVEELGISETASPETTSPENHQEKEAWSLEGTTVYTPRQPQPFHMNFPVASRSSFVSNNSFNDQHEYIIMIRTSTKNGAMRKWDRSSSRASMAS